MSKFNQLVGAYQESAQRTIAYKDLCRRFASILVDRFVKHFEVPRERIDFLPLDKHPEQGKTYTLVGAMHWDDDGFWHLGIVLKLTDLGAFPAENVLIRICIKGVNGRFVVRMGKEGFPEMEVDPHTFDGLDIFFEHMLHRLIDEYDQSLNEHLGGEALIL